MNINIRAPYDTFGHLHSRDVEKACSCLSDSAAAEAAFTNMVWQKTHKHVHLQIRPQQAEQLPGDVGIYSHLGVGRSPNSFQERQW